MEYRSDSPPTIKASDLLSTISQPGIVRGGHWNESSAGDPTKADQRGIYGLPADINPDGTETHYGLQLFKNGHVRLQTVSLYRSEGGSARLTGITSHDIPLRGELLPEQDPKDPNKNLVSLKLTPF